MTAFTVKFRRDYSWRWLNQNPVLEDGEPGFEINTGRFKIGDGVRHWRDLSYFVPRDAANPADTTLPEHINSPLPHPVYDEGPSFELIYENAKV